MDHQDEIARQSNVFKAGYRMGFCDWENDCPADASHDFIKGFNRGRADIDAAADEAFQSEYSLNS